MKIYTSYFANARKLADAGIKVIGIALWKPRYFTGPSMYTLAPRAFMLKEDLTREQYIECYNKYVLDKLNIQDVVKQIETMSDGKDVALCCYEKPEDFCHRHLLSNWMKSKGVDVQEYKEVVKPIVEEKGLFD